MMSGRWLLGDNLAVKTGPSLKRDNRIYAVYVWALFGDKLHQMNVNRIDFVISDFDSQIGK